MAITYYSANKLLDYNIGGSTYSLPTNWWIGLSTTAIAIDGSGATEPSGNGYARQQVPNSKSYWRYAALGVLQNSQPITFPESVASWGTITHIFLADAATNGNIWYYDALTQSRQVQSLTTVYFVADSFIIQMTNS